MKIRFNKLVLHCRQSQEIIDLSHQISYFHGQISAGKSSIVRLIDYCLGGDLERTRALSQELVSVQLFSTIKDNEVLFERDVNQVSSVQVTWRDSQNRSASIIAPLQAGRNPVWENEIFNLSDLIFSLSGYKPIKVRKSKLNQESELVRLSFRDLMWYCYLEQDNLDSSFYNLMDPMKRLKSRDAMRFITGFYTERMNDLEIQLDELRTTRAAKLEAAEQIRTFLTEFGYSKVSDVTAEILKIENELEIARKELTVIRTNYQSTTHFADDLRQSLRELSERLNAEKQAMGDIEERIREQEALRAELISAKFKLSRAETATNLLSGVSFEFCPACGSKIDSKSKQGDDKCYLCGHETTQPTEDITAQSEAIRKDLSSRIDDLTESIKRHRIALKRQQSIVLNVHEEKSRLDQRLDMELVNYDSSYLSSARELEQRVATYEERKRNLERMVRMPQAITQIEKEASELLGEIEIIRREMQNEKGLLSDAEDRIKEIERYYLEALLRVGVPGVLESDRVGIDRQSWIPKIYPPNGDSYNFYNAGSGGKKTLLNVCYALAVHQVATEHNLPLPIFLMIDTPMKNIGEDVNRELFHSFYDFLYSLAKGTLAQAQFIIIDKEYFPPSQDSSLVVYERFMSPDAPLISYYRGP
jgi:uncharacterized Zn finger protein (UPF0148 family)